MPVNYYNEDSLTWHPDRTKLKRPLYKSLVTLLKEDILSNNIPKDTKLPSQRELADYLDINFTTVGQAYRYGIKKGLLYTDIGKGTFTSPNAYKELTISRNNVDDKIIDLGLVSSFDDCNSLIVPFIKSVSEHPQLTKFLDYSSPKGAPHQLVAASNWLSTQGVAVSEDCISIVSGTQNGLAIVLASLFSPGDRIAVDRFTYPNFIELAHLYHLEIVPIDFDEEGMCPQSLELECFKKKIHGIFLMPSCNNPIGFQISLNRRQELAKIMRKEKLIIIEDDAHSFLTTYFQNKVIAPFQNLLPNQTVYLAGMTKYISSGLRITYMIYPDKFKQIIEKAIFNINVKTSGLDSEIITQIIQSPVAKEILEIKYNMTRKANELFDEIFSETLPIRPSNEYPFYRILPLKKELIKEKQNKIEGHLLSKGVRVYHSERFSKQTQPDPFIRVSLSSNNIDDLEKGLRIIEKERKIHNSK